METSATRNGNTAGGDRNGEPMLLDAADLDQVVGGATTQLALRKGDANDRGKGMTDFLRG